MTIFPALEGKEIIALLQSFGFSIQRQKGSHCFVKHPDGRATVVPVHGGETIGPGLLSKILRDGGMTREEFYKNGQGKNKG